ncbi:hypothetical protein L0222_30170 [bacterium]|nr:hypothetical protein [bacterium]MCI0602307.1 hypothetical protein [bacterium]
MGDQQISDDANLTALSSFMQELLADVSALERMHETGVIESCNRIGAEASKLLEKKLRDEG